MLKSLSGNISVSEVLLLTELINRAVNIAHDSVQTFLSGFTVHKEKT